VAELYLIRHGQASFGAADYDQLSDVGLEQCRRLGRWLAESGPRFDLAVTGTLRRHRQTAEACLAALQPPGRQAEDAGLNEYDHREMLMRHDARLATPEGMRQAVDSQPNPRRAFQEIFSAAFARWVAGRHDAEYAESFATFRRRCCEALLRQVADLGRSERAIVFTSGGPIAVIAQSALGIPDERVAALNFSLANAAVTTMFSGASGLKLGTLNAFQHLQQVGAERLVTYR
jgi:broad specificity phosphatase PhoE